ncbi:MAG: alpha-amylase family glycosyl hydrolase [Pseudomonadota bacterium]
MQGNSYGEQEHVFDKNRPETLDFIRRLRQLTDRYPGAFMVGEIGDDNGMGLAKEYTEGDELLHTAYNFSLFDKSLSAGYIKGVFEYFDAIPGNGYPSWAISNHDVSRAISRWGGDVADPQRAKQLNALLATLPGTVFMYQGEELGLPDAPIPADRVVDPASERGSLLEGRDPERVPMPWDKDANQAGFTDAADSWLPIPERYHEMAVSVQDADPDSTLNYTRRVNAWRKANPHLADAPIEFYQGVDEPLLAFKRGTGDEQVTVMLNMTGDEREFRLHNYDLIEDITGQRLLGPGEFIDIKIPPYGLLVKAADDKRPFPLPTGPQSQWQRADGSPLARDLGTDPGQSWGDAARRLLDGLTPSPGSENPQPSRLGPQRGFGLA